MDAGRERIPPKRKAPACIAGAVRIEPVYNLRVETYRMATVWVTVKLMTVPSGSTTW